jgi:hypothetical protein
MTNDEGDGSAHLAMKVPCGENCHRMAIYGPGSKLNNPMAEQVPCGEPVAVVETTGNVQVCCFNISTPTVTLTMASPADAVLLLAMVHCGNFAIELYGGWLASF